ncbi:hypothetical protein [Pseudonocardia sp. ICBG1293]|uniref:hypothetical protein n=1 Tax=Pseudonocardia sp. ICBG1293 TaxID=2844382 RepID=UPI001CC92E6C|nr:hypothetical protein [Pseudonocardia sp. ICBG1293]
MSDDRGPVTGRRILTVLLVLSAALHVRLAVVATGPVLAGLEGLVAAAAVAGLALLLRRPDGTALLGCAVAGGAGVALFLVPGLVAVAGGGDGASWLDGWAFGTLLVDAMVVRIAVFTLRRVEGAPRR